MNTSTQHSAPLPSNMIEAQAEIIILRRTTENMTCDIDRLRATCEHLLEILGDGQEISVDERIALSDLLEDVIMSTYSSEGTSNE